MYTSLALLCAKEMRQLLIQSSVQIRPHICLHATCNESAGVLKKDPSGPCWNQLPQKNTLNIHCEAS